MICAVAALASHVALAEPPTSYSDEVPGYFGIEARGLIEASSGSGAVHGGDAHVAFEPAQLAIVAGGRYETDSHSELAGFDFGLRWFTSPTKARGWFIGGGGFLGAEYVDNIDVARLDGIYGEVGLEWPRTSRARLTGSVRLDWLGSHADPDLRVMPPAELTMLSLNVGVFLGGRHTRALPPPPQDE
jgi:hypothetical protein